MKSSYLCAFYYFCFPMNRQENKQWKCRRLLFLWIILWASAVGAWAGEIPVSPVRSDVPDSVLSHLFRAAVQYADTVEECYADFYLKGLMKVHKRNRIIKYVPSMFRFEKGVDDYIYESVSELHYAAPRICERKIRAVSTTFPGGSSRFFDVMDFLKFNIYSPSVMDDKILSPLSREMSLHYRYRLEEVEHRPEEDVYKISVTPRYRSTQLLEGVLWISTADWSIRHFDLRGSYDLIRFRVGMTMGATRQTRFLPQSLNLDVEFRFLRNKLEMNYTGWMKYGAIRLRQGERKTSGTQKKYDFSTAYTLTCDTTRLVENRDSFARMRPLPLTAWEDSLYASFDRRRNSKPDTVKYETKLKKSMVLMGQVGDALIRNYDVDFSRMGNIRFSPLLNPVLFGYSHSRGFSYRQEFKYNKLFHTGRLLHLVPQIGYNFKQKELYAGLDGEFTYNPRKNGSLSISVGNGNRIYSSVVLDQLKELPLDSTLNFDQMNLEYFKDVYLNLLHNVELFNGFTLKTGVAMHWRYTAARPDEVSGKVALHYNSFAPRVRVEWTPGMRYYINGNRKVNIGSDYPSFVVDYEQGLGILKNSGLYGRFEASVEQKIQIRRLHSIAYHVGGGFFTKQKDVYFVDYADFSSRNLPQGWDDDIGGTFQMLDSRWYNASRHYFRGNFTFETPFLLLYPVGRLLSFVQKERLYGGILFMPRLTPYVELGYGLGTHLFDFGIFIGNENGKFTSVGCKFTFELFNK